MICDHVDNFEGRTMIFLILGEEEFLEDQVAMMMELRSPYVRLVNQQ